MLVEKNVFNRKVKVYSNRPKTINEMLENAVLNFPTNEILVQDDIRISYKEMSSIVEVISANLQDIYNIKKGERIALLLNNNIEFVLTVFAAAKLGAIVVPLNTRLHENELIYMLEHSSAKLLITESDSIEKVNKITSNKLLEFKNILVVKDKENELNNLYEPYEILKENNQLLEFPVIQEEDPIFILYTSGTTGLPKGAVLSHIGVVHGALSFKHVLQTDDKTRSLIAIPLFHVSGLIAQLMHTVLTGGTTILMKRYQTESFIKILSKERVTYTFNVPTIYTMILSSGLLKEEGYPLMKSISYGGAPMPIETIYRLQKYFQNANFQNAYGATETSSPAVIMPIIKSQEKYSSIGCPVPVGDLKIVNDQFQECSVNEPGELLIKGPMVIEKYWNNDKANEQSFIGDFWKSGDIAKIDEEGFIYLLDRKKELINRGGEKIYSVEIENVLYNYKGILEATVVGVPDQLFGEKIKAFIVEEENKRIDKTELIKYLENNLAKYKVPEEITFINELPRNPAGKVLKRNLIR